MKALRTKVILSGIVLVFAFIATIGTTFAWFTVSQTATVEEFTLNVTAEDSLLIQVAPASATDATGAPDTASGYLTSINNAAIEGQYADFQDYRLRPVTAVTAYFENNGAVALTPFNLKTITPNAAKSIAVDENESDINSVTGRFIELKFYLFYQSADTGTANLILSNPSVIANALNEATGDIADAVRLSIRLGSAGTEFIFGNTVDFGFVYQEGSDGYFAGGFNGLIDKSMVDGSGLLNATNVSNAANVVAFANAGTTVLGQLTSETPELITVRIYVEGWAAATTNDIISAIFDIDFGFAIQ